MREKILITGSEGFVGRHLTTMLQKKYEIIKFDIKIDPFQDVRDYSYLFRFMKKKHINGGSEFWEELGGKVFC